MLSVDLSDLAALFEGEFSGTTESYSGKGSIRRAW
jgi:hypothetical protein